MGIIIFAIACLVETIFFIWSFVTKNGQDNMERSSQGGGTCASFFAVTDKGIARISQIWLFCGAPCPTGIVDGHTDLQKKREDFQKRKVDIEMGRKHVALRSVSAAGHCISAV